MAAIIFSPTAFFASAAVAYLPLLISPATALLASAIDCIIGAMALAWAMPGIPIAGMPMVARSIIIVLVMRHSLESGCRHTRSAGIPRQSGDG